MIQHARRSARAEYLDLLEAAHRICADLDAGLDPRMSRPDAVATLSSYATSTSRQDLGRNCRVNSLTSNDCQTGYNCKNHTGWNCKQTGVPETAGRPAVEIWLELETRCNLTCKFCYNYWKDGKSPAPRRLGTRQILHVLDEVFSSVDCTQITVSGGEPLLRRDLPEILAHIARFDVPTVITTNGTLLTPDRVAMLVDAGVATVQLPLHAVRPEVHDYLTGRPSWDDTIVGLALLHRQPVATAITFVASSVNLHDFPAVLHLCGILGLKHVIFNRFIPSGLGTLHQDEIGVPTDEELLPVLRIADTIAGEWGIAIHLGTPIQMSDTHQAAMPRVQVGSCPVATGQKRWTIGSDGSLRRCNHSARTFGNLLGDGPGAWVSELASPLPRPRGDGIEPCQFIQPQRLVQLSMR